MLFRAMRREAGPWDAAAEEWPGRVSVFLTDRSEYGLCTQMADFARILWVGSVRADARTREPDWLFRNTGQFSGRRAVTGRQRRRAVRLSGLALLFGRSPTLEPFSCSCQHRVIKRDSSVPVRLLLRILTDARRFLRQQRQLFYATR